ncbi:MAG: tRNA (guanine(10)-N2)-dimethyltransferase [Euryarchaeota archaeon ADurb.BinA087]|nr:MAG: tRNA (guanine(10)-N2)-dimethyltransferase [Euryarchaeota archaeon ADurb.BinA087]HNQ25686.1 methyltransferase domain-containing protein [Methanoregulaceae archaeon]
MRLIIELSGEHPELPFAELQVVGEVIDKRPQVAVVESGDPWSARRLAMAHSVLEYLGDTPADAESFTAMVRDLGITAGCPFAVRVKKIAGSAWNVAVPELERHIGSMITGPVDLEDPGCEFRAILSGDRCYFGKVLFHGERPSYELRRPGSRTFFHPGVMMPRLARALVNISLVASGETLLDPFCGTGGIVLEAILVGARGIGSDIDPFMVSGSRKNVGGAEFVQAACGALPFGEACIDAVVTDLPYGQSVSIVAGSLDSLYDDALLEIRRVLLPGKRAVIVTHRDISRQAAGILSVRACYAQRVHKSLTRRILVLER